jgi:hypothetical protein
MAAPLQLPELPLMLAGIPRPVESLLREAGIPAEPLPQLPLLAAGTGRFVLFDGRSPRGAARARRVAAHGLRPIDIQDFLPAAEELGPDQDDDKSDWRPAMSNGTARAFLERLKAGVEARGGVWVRLADYPFPFQSAISLGVEHLSEELAGFAEIAATLPGMATHFVSSRLRPDRLAFLAQAGQTDLGWEILPEDCEPAPRRTLSHWKTRMERFTALNLRPSGLALSDATSPIPAINRLRPLGLRYSCVKLPGAGCAAESCSPPAESSWIRFRTLPLPPREMFVEWVGEHYQSGCPLFLSATTERLDLVQELLGLAGDAGRCSLMWRTSFGRFSKWWALRRQLRLQVWRTDTGHEIHATGDFGRFTCGVEIWRGNHLATLPLRNSSLFVPDDGLLYLQSAKRNPAGCTAPGDGVRDLVSPQEETQVRGPFLSRSRFRRKGSPE